MKVGIVTFQQTNNYGAILQNYALQRSVKQMGNDVETIDYRSEYIGKPYRLIHLKKKGLSAYLFGIAGYLCYLPRTGKCCSFRGLIRYSAPYNKNNICEIADAYDVYITGSDQVWNYKLTGGDRNYFLDFVPDKSKCNSFAASLGLSEIGHNEEKMYQELLEDFHAVTVREQRAEQLLHGLIAHKVETVSDPCFLLARDEWRETAVCPDISEPYILVYQLGVSSDLVKAAQTLAKKHHLKVIFVPFPVGRLARGQWKMTAGPAELIGYISQAEYVFTDSFHGTVFSILFNRKFFTKVSGTHSGVGSRIYDILERYGLSDRTITGTGDLEREIDYTEINRLVGQDRTHARAVLAEICS